MTSTNNTPPTEPDAQQPRVEGLDDATCCAPFGILHVDHNIYVTYKKVRYRITSGEWEAYFVNADDGQRAQPVESKELKRRLSEALENHIRTVTREGNIAARTVRVMNAAIDRVRDAISSHNAESMRAAQDSD